MRVHGELLGQSLGFDEFWAYTWEMLVEGGLECLWGIFKCGVVSCWCEEGAGEGFIEGGDSDEHELAAWPDMQVVWGDGEIAIFSRWDPELAPKSIDVLLLVVYAGELHHVESGG